MKLVLMMATELGCLVRAFKHSDLHKAKQNKYFVSCNMLGKKEGRTVGQIFYNLSETKTNLNSHNNL